MHSFIVAERFIEL